mmetsp:Transcript_118984/g.379418  ORF Transcript_118984/g.379418 Transcript_118984/m.379418 type:complete len:696 (+) Transcript_118984:79-2166(+)|eukprot:CAMPEP_0203927668 /NCGR_PEP_ID=MMETSP0359-20131031/67057_1 /ASSEMBLY_ACC=CAM_ASM_000338 /TAXON_ID=268821 /ORGANISM="Scrippsiella Hangoei, Strain SHTV-5" /LENGTH=695 /DNA_ID=CAMNT_0050856471 /DNA_START=52 /DNA_END=2139 /DNA_ORIENTATION=+
MAPRLVASGWRRSLPVVLSPLLAGQLCHCERPDTWPLEETFVAKVPGILDCTWDEEWVRFQQTMKQNAEDGFPFEDEIFEQADRMISKHLVTFLEFHRTKSNEFFHDCDREKPRGVICLYGMLSALFVHTFYLRQKVDHGVGSTQEQEVLGHSISLARLLVINKNNCLDFYASSNWPITLAQFVKHLHPRAEPASSILDDPSDPFPRHDGGEAARTIAAEPVAPSRGPAWQARWPTFASASAKSLYAAGAPSLVEAQRLAVYITGTHVALAREPAEMLRRFAGPLLGCEFDIVLEIVDDQHCDLVGCAKMSDETTSEGRKPAGRLAHLPPVGLRELALPRFRPRWTGLDIEGFSELVEEFRQRFAAHPLHREVDLFVCSSPTVLCTLVADFDRPIIAYMGEPLLLGVAPNERDEWFVRFEAMARDERNFFACYNPFLSDMIEYQTGLAVPVIRMHGLYTNAVYTPTRSHQVLVVKGPNICVDPACLLNRFSWDEDYFHRPHSTAEADDAAARGLRRFTFFGLDELGGAPYPKLASFRATIMYPYDVALAIFYELYSMGMPIFLPKTELLPFYIFRGLHSDHHYHFLKPGFGGLNGTLPPFVPSFGIEQWWSAGPSWSAHTDFSRFPHLLRFETVAELLAALAPGATDWAAVSAAMQRFNQETLVLSSAQWAAAVAGTFAPGVGARTKTRLESSSL